MCLDGIFLSPPYDTGGGSSEDVEEEDDPAAVPVAAAVFAAAADVLLYLNMRRSAADKASTSLGPIPAILPVVIRSTL